MIAENPVALAYILPGDVYLLSHEKPSSPASDKAPAQPEQILTSPPEEIPAVIQAAEPIVPYIEPAPTIQHQSPAITSPVITETPAINFNYTGGFKQKFLIVVHYPDHELMEPAHFNALESAIKRRGLSIDEVAIFNIAKHAEADLKAVGRFFKPQKMLLLGENAIPPGLDTPALNLLTKLGKCDMLYSYSFAEMMGNKENTKAFWEQMKML